MEVAAGVVVAADPPPGDPPLGPETVDDVTPSQNVSNVFTTVALLID